MVNDGAPVVILPYLANGRYRLYKVHCQYSDNGGPILYYPAEILVEETSGLNQHMLALSPASPSDSLVFTDPGSDMNIGQGVNCNVFAYPNTYHANSGDITVLVEVTYAVL
jgi:hypothetical protein